MNEHNRALGEWILEQSYKRIALIDHELWFFNQKGCCDDRVAMLLDERDSLNRDIAKVSWQMDIATGCVG